MAAVEACGDLEEQEAMLSCLRTEFEKDDHPDVRVRIIRNLDHFEDAAAVPLYITGLDQRGEVRREAAIALANLGSPTADPARQKLLDVLPNTDALDRTQVVWALAVLGESNAADAIIEQFVAGRLQDMEGWNPGVITRVLGAERLASDELLNHEEDSVRLLTAQALAESGEAAAIDPLSRLVDHELARPAEERNTEVIRSAATGLGRTGDPRAATPLFRLLENEPSMTEGIIAALGQSINGVQLAALIGQSSDVSIQRELVRLVSTTHDPDTADALAGLIDHEDEEIRNDSAVALADLGDPRAVPRLIAMAQGENEQAADAALDGLERLGPAEAAGDLLALLPPSCPDEPDPTMPAGCFRQAAILRALGATGTPEAAQRIERALTGVDAPAAAQALATMNYEPAFRRLLTMVERPADVDMTATSAAERSIPNEDLLRNRKGAILAMKIYGRPDAVDALMKVVEDEMDDYELRAYAAHAIGRSATPDQLQVVLNKATDEAVGEAARRYYVQALWQKPQPTLNAQLIQVMGSDAPVAVRRAAAIAVGYGANPEADQGLIALLENEEGRRVASFSIALGGSKAAARALVAALGEDSDAEEILQFAIMDEQSEWFDLLTEEMFETGAAWHRIEASRILQAGDRQGRYAYAWLKTVNVLESGWEGPGGASPQFIRMQIYATLTGGDAERRVIAADLLGAMGEMGLLLKARDSGGPGAEEARNVLTASTTPT
jgi:HEAT repeat protein